MNVRLVLLWLFSIVTWVTGIAVVGTALIVAGLEAAADSPRSWDVNTWLILAAGGMSYVVSAVLLGMSTWKRHRPWLLVIVLQIMTIVCVVLFGVMFALSPAHPLPPDVGFWDIAMFFCPFLSIPMLELAYLIWLRIIPAPAQPRAPGETHI